MNRLTTKFCSLSLAAFKAVLVINFAILTAEAIAGPITHGNLITNTTDITITNTLTGIEYLRFDALANLTYAETLDEIGVGGTYFGWHIATQEEAFNFMNGALASTGNAFVDNLGQTNASLALLGYQDGDFGANHTSDKDSFWFLAEEGREVGWAAFTPFGGNNISINDFWNDIVASDSYAVGGDFSNQSVSWLLVKNKSSPVPETSTLFLLWLGLVGIITRKKPRPN